MAMELVQAFNAELTSLYEMKPPISKAKMGSVTKTAIKGIKMYKHVVQSVERFIVKCRPEYKLPGVYVIDSIVRQSRHTWGPERDVFGPRFMRNFPQTFQNLFLTCPNEDRPKIVRVLNLWQKNGVFGVEVIQPLLDMANPNANLTHHESEGTTSGSVVKDPDVLRHLHKIAGNLGHLKQEHHSHHSSSAGHHASGSSSGATGSKFEFNKDVLRYNYSDDDEDDPIDNNHSDGVGSGDEKGETPTESEPPISISVKQQQQEMTDSHQQQQLSSDTHPVDNSNNRNPLAMSISKNLLSNPDLLFRLIQQQQQNQHQLSSTASTSSDNNNHDNHPHNNRFNNHHENNDHNLNEIHVRPLGQDNCHHPDDNHRQVTHDNLDRYGERRQQMHYDSSNRNRDSPPVASSSSNRRKPSRFSSRRSRSRSPVTRASNVPSDDDNNSYNNYNNRRSSHRPSPPPAPVRESRFSDVRRDDVRHETRGPSPESIEREKERDRRRKGLPTVRPGYLTICSTTLWLGHLPKMVSEADVSDAFGEFGTINSIDLIGPRGCGYLCMNRRQDAYRALQSNSKNMKLHGTTIKMAWAPGKGMKGREFKDFWDVDSGVSYIPLDRLSESTDLDLLEEGGMIDEDSLPQYFKDIRQKKAQEKEELEKMAAADKLKQQQLAEQQESSASDAQTDATPVNPYGLMMSGGVVPPPPPPSVPSVPHVPHPPGLLPNPFLTPLVPVVSIHSVPPVVPVSYPSMITTKPPSSGLLPPPISVPPAGGSAAPFPTPPLVVPPAEVISAQPPPPLPWMTRGSVPNPGLRNPMPQVTHGSSATNSGPPLTGPNAQPIGLPPHFTPLRPPVLPPAVASPAVAPFNPSVNIPPTLHLTLPKPELTAPLGFGNIASDAVVPTDVSSDDPFAPSLYEIKMRGQPLVPAPPSGVIERPSLLGRFEDFQQQQQSRLNLPHDSRSGFPDGFNPHQASHHLGFGPTPVDTDDNRSNRRRDDWNTRDNWRRDDSNRHNRFRDRNQWSDNKRSGDRKSGKWDKGPNDMLHQHQMSDDEPNRRFKSEHPDDQPSGFSEEQQMSQEMLDNTEYHPHHHQQQSLDHDTNREYLPNEQNVQESGHHYDDNQDNHTTNNDHNEQNRLNSSQDDLNIKTEYDMTQGYDNIQETD